MYISEKIKNEYKQWEAGDKIFISAPTGSGKSHFILHTLLYWRIEQRISGKMLYLVNRKVLKKQIEAEIRKMPLIMACYSIENWIDIETYQSIERALRNGNSQQLMNWFRQYDLVVYDECHYFYSDSNFNTYTQLSFDCLMNTFGNKIQIFMSATMEKVKKKIEDVIPESVAQMQMVQGIDKILYNVVKKTRVFEYEMPGSYDYVNIKVFKDYDDLKVKVKEDSEANTKWLIFVDNIERGKELKKSLENGKDSISKEEMIFIDANYKNDNEASEVVNEISEKSYASKKIVITTAVMDNGISFKDFELRNIVILADTRESFIQMLGRKRNDGKKITLYLCKRSQNHFSQRLQSINKILDFYMRYEKSLNAIYVWGYNEDTGESRRASAYSFLEFRSNMDYWKQLQNCYKQLSYQQVVMDAIWNDKIYDKAAKNMLYFYNGLVACNEFAAQKCDDLKQFYGDMANAMESDENAFLKQQLMWLGIENKEKIIEEAQKDTDERNRDSIKEVFESVLNQDMNKEGYGSFLNQIREACCCFMKKSPKFADSVIRDMGKKGRPIVGDNFKNCMQIAGLPYILERPTRSIYRITKECKEIQDIEPSDNQNN